MTDTVQQPTTPAELSSLLQHAYAAGTPVRIDPSPAPPAGIALTLAKLSATIEHCAGDLTATIPAGVTLAEANRVLMQDGQWLPLDPPNRDARIGAVIAANSSGPRRHRFGTPRDLIIGVDLALADGRLAKAGGRVVKNVAGYDLARLMCGSRGTLAVITSATFKLSPWPAASRTVVLDGVDESAFLAAIDAIGAAPITPTAVEFQTPPFRLLVRFETTAGAAAHQAAVSIEIAGQHGVSGRIVSDGEEAAIWAAYEARTWAAHGPLLKLSVPPAQLASALRIVATAAGRHAAEYSLAGRAALGLLFLRLHSDANASAAALIAEVGDGIAALDGHLIVEDANGMADLIAADLGDARPLMQALKRRFDPRGILNPGRGPGGL